MSIRTLVVHGDIDEPACARMALAIELARAHRSKLLAVFPLNGYSADFLDAPYAPLASIERHVAAERRRAAEGATEFANKAQRAGVQAEWKAVEGRPADVLATIGAAADIIVMSDDGADGANELVPAVTLTSGRPVLCVPRGWTSPVCARRILVAWNGSREAARAASDALPLLQAAEEVIVFSAGAAADGCAEAQRGAAYLAAHHVTADIQYAVTSSDRDAGRAILKAATDSRADLIVMGIYGHHRWREWALGGATRTVLRSLPVPALLSY